MTLVPTVFMPEARVSNLSSGDVQQLHLRARAKYEEKKRKDLLENKDAGTLFCINKHKHILHENLVSLCSYTVKIA